MAPTIRRLFGPRSCSPWRSWPESHYAEAETTGRELLDVQRRVLGPEHKDTLATMNNLANISESLGHFKEAEALLHEAVEGMRSVVGPEAPAMLATMNTLGNVYADEGRYADAAKLLEQTLEVQRRTLGPEHPYALESAFALADVYDSEGRYTEAEKLALGVVTTYERTKFQNVESVAAARGGARPSAWRTGSAIPRRTATARRRAPASHDEGPSTPEVPPGAGHAVRGLEQGCIRGRARGVRGDMEDRAEHEYTSGPPEAHTVVERRSGMYTWERLGAPS